MLKKTLFAAATLGALSMPAFAGDPAPGVDVVLEQIPGGQVYTAKTDADGNMIFDDLPPGEYRVYQEIEKPKISVSGPATFTPSDGDDIGTLTVTSKAPIVIDKIVARPLTDEELDRAAIPMAESWNSSRSNKGNIVAPAATDEEIEADAVPMAESLNTTRSNTGGIVAPVDARTVRKLMQRGELKTVTGAIQMAPVGSGDAAGDTPLAAESLNSVRSNKGNIVEAANEGAEDKNE